MLPVPQCPGGHVGSFSLAAVTGSPISDGPLFWFAPLARLGSNDLKARGLDLVSTR